LPAHYVVVEGGDGCGKDTQLPIIEQRIKDLGLKVVVVREPYDSPNYGQMIHDMLNLSNGREDFSQLYWVRQAQLMNSARKEVIALVQTHLAAGRHVLASRNWFSTMAYQGHAKGIRASDIEQLRMMCRSAASAVQPSLLVLLDMPAAEGLGRQADKVKDVNELLPEAFHAAVRAGYLVEAGIAQAQEDGSFPVALIDASGVGIEDLTDQIWAHLGPLFEPARD